MIEVRYMTHRDFVTLLPRRAVLTLVPAAALCLWFRETVLAADDVATATDAFLLLSKRLTGFPDINPELAIRLREALINVVPATSQAVARLIPIGLHASDDSTLMMTARNAGLGEAALAVVGAWYTGTVGSDAHAEVVAYADALMYRTVADGLAPPTYALGGPAWWVSAPPPAGVSPPMAEHAQPGTQSTRGVKPS
jgi:fructose 5-dehydrogenase small subunit